jgi:hypothetical protein
MQFNINNLKFGTKLHTHFWECEVRNVSVDMKQVKDVEDKVFHVEEMQEKKK